MLDLIQVPYVTQSLPFTCGPACLESVYRHLRGSSPSELDLAEMLGTFILGYTPPKNIYNLAMAQGYSCSMKEQASWQDLIDAMEERRVVIVTWWDEDAGHYSLLKGVKDGFVVLMDPLMASDCKDNRIELDFFKLQWQARGSVMISFENG
jgi:predicted double-glycine peptidase